MLKQAVYHNKSGYLMFEQVIVLIIVSFFSILILSTLTSSLFFTHHAKQNQMTELTALANQLQASTTYATQIIVLREDVLILKTPAGDQISYEVHHQNLIRKRNNTGYEIVLYDCLALKIVDYTHTSATVSIKTPTQPSFIIYLTSHYIPIEQFQEPEVSIIHEIVK